MRVQLRYSESVLHPTRAALIRGDSPEGWLREMNRWGLAPEALACYVVPESIHSLRPAGLFVVFQAGAALEGIDFPEPYGGLEERLFLPVHADVFPVLNPDELKKGLVWERQLFHPTIGLVGFSPDDAVDPAHWLAVPPPLKTNWTLAHPGWAARPRLQQIRMPQPTVHEVLESFKEGFQSQPLDKIPGKAEVTPLSLRNGLLGLLMAIPQALGWMLQTLIERFGNEKPDTTRTQSSAESSPPAPDWLRRLRHWLTPKMRPEDVANKQKSEIERLLNLFGENMEEALKYAIPLDSPYLNRGSAEPGSQLMARLTPFDFRRLGGGGPVDHWDVGEYYADLRKNYYLAATKAIEANDFKRAAYIYAHLLGDLPNAARSLEQGKYYREAAILYKDHLKNRSQAASCFETGGLLLEAIDEYLALEKYEKVGDLYQTMNQSAQAAAYYEKSAGVSWANQDFLEAARIFHDKLEQTEKARQILLTGWKESKQSEQCLKQYFDGIKTDPALLNQGVRDVFSLHTPKPRRASFLNVLVQLNESQAEPRLLETARNLAYEIISEEAGEGNLNHLHVLKKFLPEDRLIAADCSRYTTQQASPAKNQVARADMHLDREVRWVTALCYRNQYLALGIKEATVQLVRGNWYGHFESYAWNHAVKENECLKLIADPLYSQQVVLYASSGQMTEEKTLPKNKYFDQALQIVSPAWLVDGFTAFTFNASGGICSLMARAHQMSIHHYSAGLALKKSVDCRFENEIPFLIFHSSVLADMTYGQGHYYTHRGSFLIQIAEEGEARWFNVQAAIHRLVAATVAGQFVLALATEQGARLVRPTPDQRVTEEAFFARELVPIVSIRFVAADKLVVAGKHQVKVYRMEGGTTPQLLHTFETHSPIVDILSPPHRNRVAWLEESGRIASCDLDSV